MDDAFLTPEASPRPAGPSGRPEPWEVGLQIGDFRIERLLGYGGMGVVYLARQVSLDRPVALKVMGAALNREADIDRFGREAQAIARLDHPGIAGIRFVGQDREVAYLAMEFIEGVSLRKVIERLSALRERGQTLDSVLQTIPIGEGEAPEVRFDQPTVTYAPHHDAGGGAAEPGALTPEAEQLLASAGYLRRCCEVAREAAEALAHAHERGVVHRDIKPDNLLLDRRGRVHVIDFGLARSFEDATVTHSGALLGTPVYMSPEQVAGRLRVDHRTDVYSLGLVLYELLALRRPIAAPTREGILRQVLTKEAPPLTWANGAVPRELEAVVHRAIAKDPDARYSTAAALAADLANWLAGRPVAAAPYRFGHDRAEIAAARPEVAVVGSAIFYVFAVLFLYVGFRESLAVLTGSPAALDDNRPMIAVVLLFGLVSAHTATSLLACRRRRAVAGALLGFAALCYLVLAVLPSLAGATRWDEVARTLVFFGACFVSYAAAVALVFRPRVRAWFDLADRVRAEHRRLQGPAR
jgi:serine/threonine protein kinase